MPDCTRQSCHCSLYSKQQWWVFLQVEKHQSRIQCCSYSWQISTWDILNTRAIFQDTL